MSTSGAADRHRRVATAKVALAVALCVAAGAATAQAQQRTPPSDAAARAATLHVKQGDAFYDAGAYNEAIIEYHAAYEILALPELLDIGGDVQGSMA